MQGRSDSSNKKPVAVVRGINQDIARHSIAVSTDDDNTASRNRPATVTITLSTQP